ncbi:ParB/RepB/Spo0J family partition protein [Vreelandella venusta]
MSTDTFLDRDMLDSLSKKSSDDQFKTQMGTLDHIKQQGELQKSAKKVKVEDILVEQQVRQSPVSEDAVINLAQSMESVGLLQPITISPLPESERISSGKRYRLEVGETRFRAANVLGWDEIQVNLVERPEDVDRLRRQLIENIQRNNLNPIEVAEAIESIKSQSSLTGKKLTYTRIAEDLGMTSSNISEHIALLKLSEKVQILLVKGKLKDRRAAVLLDEINSLKPSQGELLIKNFQDDNGASRAELKKILQQIKSKQIAPRQSHSTTEAEVARYHFERKPAKKIKPEEIEYIVEGKLISGKSVRGTLLQGWLAETEGNEPTGTIWIRQNDGQTLALDKVTALYQRSVS